MSELERLKNQLLQLEKTFKSGIISEEEYIKGKNNIEKKLKPLEKEHKKNEEGKKVVEEIISKKEEKQESKKEETKPKPFFQIKDKEEPKKEIKEDKPKDDKKEKKEPLENSKKEEKSKEKKESVEKLKKETKEEKSKQKKEKNIKTKKKEKKKFGFFWIFILVLLSIFLFLLLTKDTNNEQEIITPKNLTNVTKIANIEVYSSFSCKPCYELDLLLDKIKIMYGENVIITRYFYPLNLENDIVMDKAYYCVKTIDVEKTNDFKTYLYKEKKPISVDKLNNYIKDNEINFEEYEICFNDIETIYQITNEYKNALNKEITLIPTIFINNAKIEKLKDFEIYEAIINRNLEI
jgi:hypothetical protein